MRVLPDTTAFARSLARYLERIEARTVLNIRTRTDVEQIGKDVATAVKTAEKSALIHIGAGIDASGLVRETRRAAAVAEKTARLRLPVDLDLKRVAAGIATVAALLAGGLKAAALPLALAGAVVHALALGKALAPAAGALAALPGIAIAAAGAIAALKIGLVGVGDALKGDAEAMAKLAPSARAFVVEVQRLGPAWLKVRQAIQGNLFANLNTEIRSLAATWLPILQTQLSGVAAGWNLAFRNAGEMARTPAFIADMTAALQSSVVASQQLSGALAPILSILATLAPFGAEMFASMAGAIRVAATDFAAFLTTAKETGQLGEFFAGVKSTLIGIGGALGDIGAIAGAVFTAASNAGSGFLGPLGQILDTVRTFVTSVEGQTALTTFFASAMTVLQAILPLVTTLAGAFGTVLAPAIAKIATLLGPGLQTVATALVGVITALIDSGALDALASGLTEGLAALGPALVPVAKALGSIVKAAAPLLPVVGKIAAVIAGVLASALTAIEPVLSALIGAIADSGLDKILADIGAQLGPLIGELISALMPTLQAILPLLGPILKVVGALVMVALALLKPILALVAPITELIALKVLTPIVELLATALTWLAEKALIPAAEWLGNLADTVSGLDWATVWQAIVNGVKLAAQWFAELPGKIMSAVFGLPGQLLTWAQGLFASLGSLFLQGLSILVSHALALPGRIISAVLSLRERALGFFAEIWSRAGQLFLSGVATLVSHVASLPSRARAALSNLAGAVLGVFGNAGSWLWDAGRRIIAGLIDGISSMVAKLKDKLRSVTNLIPSWKGPPPKDAKLLRGSGRLIMSGLMDGIAASLPALRAQLAGVTADISGQFNASAASVAPRISTAPAGLRFAGPVLDPSDLREPAINLTAYFQVGDDPVINAVEKAVTRDPERFASHVRTGERMLGRRG